MKKEQIHKKNYSLYDNSYDKIFKRVLDIFVVELMNKSDLVAWERSKLDK